MMSSDRKRRGYLSPDEAEPRSHSRDEIADACEWLRKLLKSGPLWESDVMKIAEDCDLRPSLVRRAKREIGVIPTNVNDKNKYAKWKLWFWQLPPSSRGLLFDNEQPRRKDRYPNE
jgi:hypothetical protein